MAETDIVLCGPSDLIHRCEDSSAIWVANDWWKHPPANDLADFVALSESSSLLSLFDSILSGTLNMRNGWSIVLTCNLASVLGAFIVGLTSLHVVALTNLGTWAAFSTTSRFNRLSGTGNSTNGNDGDITHHTGARSSHRDGSSTQTTLHF